MIRRPRAMSFFGYPILSNEDAAAWEESLFEEKEAKEWPAMQQAGRALAAG